MRSLKLFPLSAAIITLAAGCSKSQPETPAPAPTDMEIARQQQIQDSLDALNRFRTDSVERERQMAAAVKAHADSVEAARVAMEQHARDSLAQIAREDQRIKDELTLMVHFDAAQARIQDEDMAALDQKAAILAANPSVHLKITGAADERGSDEYNLALGNRRALAIQRYLIGKGIAKDRLETSSIGEESPVDTDSNEMAWAKNRRVEFAVMSDSSPLSAPMASME